MPGSLTPTRQLRCPTCRRVVELTPDDLLRYGGRPWPTCCGRAMDLHVGGGRLCPSDGTDPERPALRLPGGGRTD